MVCIVTGRSDEMVDGNWVIPGYRSRQYSQVVWSSEDTGAAGTTVPI